MLIQVSLRAVHKEICKKKAVTLTSQKSPLGVSLSLSHTHIGLPWGFKLIFRRAAPSLLYGSPPGDYPKISHINSDDFGGHLVLRIEAQESNIRTKDRHVIGLEIAKIVYHLF